MAVITGKFPSLNVHLYLLSGATLKRRSISDQEKQLHKNEERRSKEGLEEIVQESWRPLLKDNVSQDLENPTDDVGRQRHFPSFRVLQGKHIRRVCYRQQEWGIYGLGQSLRRS